MIIQILVYANVIQHKHISSFASALLWKPLHMQNMNASTLGILCNIYNFPSLVATNKETNT